MGPKDLAREEALSAYGSRTAKITPRDRLRNAVIVLSILVALSGLVDLFLWWQVEEVQDFQREGRERAYESRAVACSDLAQDGQMLPPPCFDRAVLAYYDPDARP